MNVKVNVNGKRKKLEWTASKGGFGGLILDEERSGPGADSMDPRGGGDFGLRSGLLVWGENRPTERAD